MTAVLLISHGSDSSKTKEEIKQLVNRLKRKCHIGIFEYAFLEVETPSIPQGIDICVKRGASQIIILLNFLNSGKHVDQDIPQIVREARRKYTRVKFEITKPVGQHEKIVDLFLDMIH